MKWISVEDQLPPFKERVLMCGNLDYANYVGLLLTAPLEQPEVLSGRLGEEGWETVPIAMYTPFKTTHWMSLPPPPEEKDNEK